MSISRSERSTPDAHPSRGAGLVALVVALVATACLSPRDGQFLCDGPGAPCPDGMACGTDGVCRVSPVGDAGPRDAGPRDGGGLEDSGVDDGGRADGGTLDGGDLDCAEQGFEDADGDGACEGEGPGFDCDDEDDTVAPTASEACAASAEGRDDDCDGGIDEGCPFHLGLVHSPFRLHQPARDHWGAWLSADGLRLYTSPVTGGVANSVHVATRPALDAPFGAPVPVPAATTDLAIFVIWLTPDELEIFAQATRPPDTVDRIYHATRALPTDPFGTFAVIASTVDDAGEQFHPTASPDGNELYYVHSPVLDDYEIRRVARSDRESPFGPSETAFSDDNPHFVRMSTDGRTLWFHRLTNGITRVDRASTADRFTAAPVPDTALGVEPALILPFHHPRARELWFTTANGDPRSPRPVSIFRAQVCRDGPCTLPTPIACDTGAGQLRSADGLRCYALTDSPGGGIGWARDRCEVVLPGSRLTSVHSAATQAELAPLRTGDYFIGANRESTSTEWRWDLPRTDLGGLREPFLWPDATDPRWASGEPSSDPVDRCAAMRSDGTFDAIDCGGRLGICLLDMWPTW